MMKIMTTLLGSRWLFVLGLLLPLSGCDSGQEGTPSGAACPNDSTLTWDNFGKGFMDSYCTRCHSTNLTGAARQGAPNDHNFESVALIGEQIDHIDEATAAGPNAVNTAMPIGSPTPTEAERRMLGEWLACGAP